jgi:hypothetical protein
VGACCLEERGQLPTEQVQSLVTLLRGIDGVTNSLAAEIATEFAGVP